MDHYPLMKAIVDLKSQIESKFDYINQKINKNHKELMAGKKPEPKDKKPKE